MPESSAATSAVLQKIFVFAVGVPAQPQLANSLAQQVAESGTWEPVRAVMQAYLGVQAQALGSAALLKQMALQGLDGTLSDAAADALAAQIDTGQISWGDVAVSVAIHIGGSLGAALANKAEAAAAFTQALQT